MKLDLAVPFEKMVWFQQKLGLTDNDLERFSKHRDLFIKRKEEFAEELYHRFYDIPETRIILEHEKRKNHLKNLWAQWFELLFEGHFDDLVYTRLWRSGLRHVELNIDKRYINLAYAFVRQYYQQITRAEIPLQEQEPFLAVMDKIVDFCVLVETHAYVSATSQCDMEVVKGISHQVRNPLTVIGGNILRLQRGLDPDSPNHRTYQAILLENERLEAMVRDAGVYSDMFQKEPVFSEISLEPVLSEILKRLEGMAKRLKILVEVLLDPRYPLVQGDLKDLETMFYYLLQNSFEAADPERPYVHISSKPAGSDSPFLRIEIFNTGHPPKPQDMDNLFIPFFSSKPQGTGFGLPIAQLAARKSLGEISLEAVEGEGTKCIIQLPLPTGEAK